MMLKSSIQDDLRIFTVLLFALTVLSGCATATKSRSSQESEKEVQEALSAVAGALSGKQLSEEEVRELERQIRTDEEAQTAIQAITESVGGKPIVKYCPVTGKRYAAHIETCPEHDVQLEIVGE